VKVPYEEIKLVPLAKPRELRPEERQVLELAVAAPGAPEELRIQAESALAVRECNCGCPSIGLSSDASPVPAAEPAMLLQATALTADGVRADVNLHLLDGQLYELEIWSMQEDPEVLTAPLDLATFEYLRY
jgi:hypothetical protein